MPLRYSIIDMNKKVLCPHCRKETTYSPENPFRPFCSERCKLIDFGDWAEGRYAIPSEDAPRDSMQTSDESGDSLDKDDEDGSV